MRSGNERKASVMANDQILERLRSIFRGVFEDDELNLTPRTTSDDVPGWDSMSNITLTIEIEHRFGIKVRTAEMEALRNVADIIDLVKTRMTSVAP